MKKIMSFLLVLVLAVGLVATTAFADAGITVIDASAAAGGTAKVTLSVSGAGSFKSLSCALNYDGSKLELTDVSSVGIFSGAMNVSEVTEEYQVAGVNQMFAWNGDNGKVAYASGSEKTGSGQLFELTFQVADGIAVGTVLPVSAEVILDDADSALTGSGSITIEGADSEVVQNTYIVDLSDAAITGSSVSGMGKVVKTGGNQPESKKYVYIVVNYQRDNGTTWAVAGTYSVDPDDGTFDIPTITGVSDSVSSVLVVALDQKLGATWAGHNIAAPAFVRP